VAGFLWCMVDWALTEEAGVNFTIECEREDDGRWLAEIALLPGVMAYGESASEAMLRAQVLALRVLAEQLETNEARPLTISISVPTMA
jgi:predicted RNase H-like HicB family nuclease